MPQKGRWIWHGSTPMFIPEPEVEEHEEYKGERVQQELTFGALRVKVENWPRFRIGTQTWPSALLLAEALALGHEALPSVRGATVAEIGAGPGVPGIVAAQLGASEVAITDMSQIVPLISRNIELNSVQATCSAKPLEWSAAEDSPLAAARRKATGLKPLNIVLAADVLYVEEQEPLVSAVEALLEPKDTIFILAYTQRTIADRAYLEQRILPLLDCRRVDYSSSACNASCEMYIGVLRPSGGR